MKKLMLVFFLSSLFLFGCQSSLNTPTSIVENFFSKYQKLDKTILKDLDKVVEKDKNMKKEEKTKYKTLMEKQYNNLSYKIKNEKVNKNKAIIDVEIEVLDYANAIYKARKYYFEHPKEFNYTIENNSVENTSNYINYKLKKLDEVKEKNKYEITLTLTKKEGLWSIDEITDIDRMKIHGLY